MKLLLWMLFVLPASLHAQHKFEVQEFQGTIKAIDPYWLFANERITVSMNNGDRIFLFNPKYGTFIQQHFKIGDPVRVKVRVNLLRKEMERKVSDVVLMFWFRDYITGIEVNGRWMDMELVSRERRDTPSEVYLDQVVREVLVIDGLKRGYVLDNGLVAYSYFQGISKPLNQEIKVGDRVSFIGYCYRHEEGFTYPIENVKKSVSFNRLYKDKGIITSFLFKQNNVCIGLVLSTTARQIKLSFPSNYAERMRKFADSQKQVTAYFIEPENYGVNENDLNPPELHAIIQGRDTIKISEFGFWGGADIKHEHKPVDVRGKITRVNKLASGVIYSVIVDESFYIDIDHATQKQLEKFFRKGTLLKVEGKERIRVEGEIYNKDYRIVIPETIMVDEKVFQIKQLP